MRCELAPGEARHVATVLRRRVGDAVVVLGTGGRTFSGSIESVGGGPDGPRVVVNVGAELESAPLRGFPWTVAAGLVKGSDFDLAVRLASELGLEGLVPVITERSQVHAARSGRPERWLRIALEAAKQCRRSEVLCVESPLILDACLTQWGGRGPAWLLRPGADLAPREELAARSPALFLVGPEGGFSAVEEAVAIGRGARPLGLPTPVLRTSTAVLLVAALGVLATVRAESADPA